MKPRCRLATMQCSPVVVLLAIGLAFVVMSGMEINTHLTRIIQFIRGVAAGLGTLIVLGGLTAVMRWVWAQGPEPGDGHVRPLTLTADEFARVAAPRADDWELDAMAAMAADADALRDGQLDFMFTAGKNLFELDDRNREDEGIS
jgi:hypothetical protein